MMASVNREFFLVLELLRGSIGVLRPFESDVVATFGVDGFTRFDLPAGRSSFTLVTIDVAFVRITNFQLRITELCANGASLFVRVEYFTKQQVVSSKVFFSRS